MIPKVSINRKFDMAKIKNKPTAPKARTLAAKISVKPKVKISAEPVAEVRSNYSFTNFISFLNNNFSLILLVGIFFVIGFIIGSLWTEKQLAKTPGSKPAGQVAEQPTNPSGPSADDLKKVPSVTKEDHIRGNANAKVVLVEYSDYECPFCNRFHPTMKQVMKEYGDKVAWVYRHYPLPFHTSAQRAAETAECVAKDAGNDVFWKYSDSVYEQVGLKGPDALTEANLKLLATQAGANGDKVIECQKSGQMAALVKKDLDGGSAAGVNGTPGTIIITGGKYELIPGALPFEQVKTQIDNLLK